MREIWRKFRATRKRDDLPRGVDACVGTPRRHDAHCLAQHPGQRSLEHPLDGPQALLAREAVEPLAVVGEDEAIHGHITSDYVWNNPWVDAAELTALLLKGPLLADGGMGTSLVERGMTVGACFEALNLDDPELVLEVHRSFVEAGARLVETNTFAANPLALARHGLAGSVRDINQAGVEVARRSGALVAGSVGPLGVHLVPYGRVSKAHALDSYAAQISAQRDAGVDLLVIETQSDLVEMEQALAAAREVCSLAVIVTATFTRDDRTLLGSTPEQVADRLTALGADAIGVNCAQGPAQVLRLIRAIRPHAAGLPLVARPNAGSPLTVGQRLLYPATPEYFADHARALLEEGVSVIGGCCGTGPPHTRAMARAIDEPHGAPVLVLPHPVHEPEHSDAPSPTRLAAMLAERRFVVAVEMDPPRGFSTARMLAGAETLADAGAHAIDVADSPMAQMRMSPWAACRLIQEHTGLETILHFPTRGRNLLRLQGDLLAVHALGIRNLFICMGDPVAIGDYPGARDLVDVAPTGLLAVITGSFNMGRDQAGSSIGEPTSFVAGCAVNPASLDLERECRLLRRKIVAGAAFALSQPVYTVEALNLLRKGYEDRYGSLDLPILVGVLPLVTGRHAEFLHNEVPGIQIPERVRDRMRKAGDSAEAEGLRLAAELVADIRRIASGLYLMPPFGRYDLAAEIVEQATASGP